MFSSAELCSKTAKKLVTKPFLWYNLTMSDATVTTQNLPDLIAEKDARIAELEALVKYYEAQLRLAKHKQFGASSEKGVLPDQLGMFDEAETTAAPKQPEPELEEVTYHRRKRSGKREEDLSSLPVETIEHDLPESERVCPDCGNALHVMAHDVRRELTIIPAQIKVTEHKRAVYSCRSCEKHNDHVPVVKAPMPEPVIKGSIASPSSVAHIINQKYVMHLPLYRQEQEWLREGISLSRQTMANWVIRVAEDWLAPLYDRLREYLLARGVLHADETVCQVLHEPGKKANTNSYMWHYRTSGDAEHPILLYEYQPTRSSAHPKRFLNGWTGYLHADGYAGYHSLPPDITIIGCWAHLRRKFTDAYKATPVAARQHSQVPEAIKRLGKLFHLESQWQELEPDERYELRLKESKPLAEAFFAWLESLAVLPKSKLGEAIAYAFSQRKWLMNVYLDGRCELSNNRAENSIRDFVIGRKNWLFCNTQRGANASSIIYSIVETAKANGLNTFAYLKFLFETVPSASMGELDSLLPWGDAVPVDCRVAQRG
jgi:transposase